MTVVLEANVYRNFVDWFLELVVVFSAVGEGLVLVASFLCGDVAGVDANLLVVLLEGSQILTGL